MIASKIDLYRDRDGIVYIRLPNGGLNKWCECSEAFRRNVIEIWLKGKFN